MTTLDLFLHTNHKRSGCWKLNTFLLTAYQVILNLIKSVINGTQNEYKGDEADSGCSALGHD